MAKNSNVAVLLILGLVGAFALFYSRQSKAANTAAITAPPPIPYNPMLPVAPAQNLANGLTGLLTGSLKSMFGGGSSGTTWAGMPTGVNQQGQAVPLLNNNAFVSRL